MLQNKKKKNNFGAKIVIGMVILGFCLPALASSQNVTAVLGGKKKKYSVPLNESTYQTIFNLPDYRCSDFGYTDATLGDCYNYLIYDRADQKEALVSLVNWLNKKIKKSDDRVRVAASLVQKMEYDYDKYQNNGESNGRGHGSRYPYEVLYENMGICGEKASLIVYLLKQLGYGTATITFLSPLHEVAGVKCSDAYDFQDTGYCFIDPNYRHMITYSGSYADDTPYRVLKISDGKTFNAKNDFKDGQTLRRLITEGIGSRKNYKTNKKLVKKYGL